MHSLKHQFLDIFDNFSQNIRLKTFVNGNNCYCTTVFYGCFCISWFTYYTTSTWKLWDGLKLWTAIKHLICTRVCKLSSLTSICRWWKWWDIFYCSYSRAWLCAVIDTSLAAAHRSSALIHVLLHTIFAGPCPRKMWLHFIATVWRTFCL